MIISIELDNVAILNIDEVITKLQEMKDNIKDGKAITRLETRKVKFILDNFGSRPIAWVDSTPGYTVKEYKANDALQAGWLQVSAIGELSVTVKESELEGSCSRCDETMIRAHDEQPSDPYFTSKEELYCYDCKCENNEMLKSNRRKLVYDDSGNEPETPPQAYTFRQFINNTKVTEASCFEEWENLNDVEVTCSRCGVLKDEDVKYRDKLQCGKCGNIKLEVEEL